MLQRVALARLLLAQSALIIADEPTSALDSTNAAAVIGLLRRTAVSARVGILLVSHDLPLLTSVADEVWTLRGQRLTPVELDHHVPRVDTAVASIGGPA